MIISGLALSGAGIFCILNRGQLFDSLAFIAGCGLLSSGVLETASRFLPSAPRKIRFLPFNEGAVSILASIAILGGALAGDPAVVTLFSFWLIFSGATRISASIESVEESQGFRLFIFGLGLISIIFGFYGFFCQLSFDITTAVFVGCCFLLQGINAAAVGIALERLPGRIQR
jgi:uncharacterized membrane protein HdeD (DUF308 family)